jgi:citrate lyase beta subunit
VEKLGREPVEDLRIDFEDGFGARSDAEEDAAALAAADEVARAMEEGTLPASIGLRVKPLAEETRERCVGTLGAFLERLVERTGGGVPRGLVVTLPKVTVTEQVAFFAALLARWEERLGLAEGVLRFETMVEVPQAVIGPDGACPLPRWVEAAEGRMTGVHLGVYDYTASLGIAAPLRGIRHPACDFARHAMQVALAGTGVWVSDGSTALLPVPVGEGDAPDREAVHRAWRRHFDDVTHSLAHGFYQGWDLHPAQLPTRYAAVFAFFLGAWEETAARLRALRERGSDDPHAADALLSFVRRGVACGAFTEHEAAAGAGTDAIRTC